LSGSADLAGGAAAAVGERGEDDGVAFLHGGHAGSDGIHHAGALVAEDDGCGVGDRAVDDAQVRVAEAGGADRDPHLARTRVADAHLLRSEEHTSELQSRSDLVCRLLLEKKKKTSNNTTLRLQS